MKPQVSRDGNDLKTSDQGRPHSRLEILDCGGCRVWATEGKFPTGVQCWR